VLGKPFINDMIGIRQTLHFGFSRALYLLGRSVRDLGQTFDKTGHAFQNRYPHYEQITLHRKIMPIYDQIPSIGMKTFVAPSASVIGSAEIGSGCAIWYGAVIRADVGDIKIGDNVSIGDQVVVHLTRQSPYQTGFPTNIGHGVLVGAGSFIHGCTLEDECYIGTGCTILDGAVVGHQAIVAPGSVVLSGMNIPKRQYWAGSPAKFERQVTDQEVQLLQQQSLSELALGALHSKFHTDDNQAGNL